jgi:hypothetical protein
VYAAQYYLEGLFEHGKGARAVELIAAGNDRSWRHMVESGTTITWEAWDQKYKPNQDWNHAWGAAPANLLARYILGVSPAAAGWATAWIRPMPSDLRFARGKVPTPRGPIQVDWERSGATFRISIRLPDGMPARVELPAIEGASGVFRDGAKVPAERANGRWVLKEAITGGATLEVR